MFSRTILCSIRLGFSKALLSRLSTLSNVGFKGSNYLFNLPKKTKDFRDHNFNFFRSLEAYEATVVSKWPNDELENYILEFLLQHSINDSKPEKFLSYLLLEHNVMSLQDSELKKVMAIIANMYFNDWKSEIPTKWLDLKCATSAHTFSLDVNLFLFDCWLVYCGHRVFQTEYFRSLLSQWSEDVSLCSKNQAMQMVYYLGLSKRAPEFLLSALMSRFEAFVHTTSPSEWAIVCLSFFKASKKIESENLLKKSVETAKILIRENNLFHVISVIKCLRLAQHYDESLTLLLKDFVKDKWATLNFVECTHVLAAFSSENVYGEDIFTLLENQATTMLRNELQDCKKHNINVHPSQRCRTKDLARFLWGLATVGHKPNNAFINTLLQIMTNRNQDGEFSKLPNTLVDCVHSLALMNIYPQRIFSFVFHEDILSKIWEMVKVKSRYQLYFIVQSMQLESNIWQNIFPTKHFMLQKLKPLPKDIFQQIGSRKELQAIKELLTSTHISESDIEYCYILPHIAIAGIFVRNMEFKTSSNGDGICIEVLDSTVCCRDSVKPIGLMEAKLRHLQKLPYKLCVVTPEEINRVMNMTLEEQKAHITSWLQ